MENLLEETVKELGYNNKTIDDVRWVGTEDVHFPWSHFVTIADVEYDPGFGTVAIASDLMIVGDGWWLERSIHEGSESWAFKVFPNMPSTEYHVPFLKRENGVDNGDDSFKLMEMSGITLTKIRFKKEVNGNRKSDSSTIDINLED